MISSATEPILPSTPFFGPAAGRPTTVALR